MSLSPDPLKPYRNYLFMFLLNLAIVAGIIYLLRREEPREIIVTQLPTRSATQAAQKAITAISVTVNGAVNQPGTFKLNSDARLADALERAGGVKPEADLSKLDLTRLLKDGDKIVVPTRATSVPSPNALAPATAIKNSPPPTAAEKINLNTATLEQLDSLPGIGPALAQRILDYRAQHSSFKSVEELKEVKGIGDALFDEIKDQVTLQ